MPLIWDTRDAEYVKPGDALTEVPTGFWENLLAAEDAFTLSSQTSSEKANLAGAYDPIIEALNADTERNALTGQATDRSAFANPYGRTVNDPLNGPDWRARYQPEELEDRIWRTIQERRAADPDALPDLPADREALRARITEQVQAAEQAAAEVRSRADTWGAVGAFTGGMTGALKDPASIATLPMGLPVARGIIGTALAEGAIGGGVTALTLPDTNRYRQGQGLDEEDPATAILFGTAGGAVFGGGARAAGRVWEGVADGRGVRGGLSNVAGDLSPSANWQSAKDMLRQFRKTVKDPTPEQRGAAAVLERQAHLEDTNPAGDDAASLDLHERQLADAERVLNEQGRLADAYDAVRRTPNGPADDPLVRIQPEDIEATLIARGGWKGKGDVEVKGAGWGLVKFIWRHGEMSGKTHKVRKADVMAFPRVIRELVPDEEGEGANRYRIWRAEREDGRIVKYVDRPMRGERHVVSVHVLEEWEPPSPKRKTGSPGSASQDVAVHRGDTGAVPFAQQPRGRGEPATGSMDPRGAPRKPLPPSLRPPAATRPKSLGTWLAREGGIDDSAVDYQGWLRRMDAHRRRPGLVNTQAGMALDDAALRAWEAGYFPSATERPTINDLLDALDEDLRGGPGRYADGDMEAAAAWAEWEAKLAELDALGIDPRGLSDAQLDAAITAAVGREAWEHAAPGVPLSDDEARAIVAEARASGREVEDVASDAAEARAAIFEAAGIRADDEIPFDAEGDAARLEAVGDDAAERWRRAEQAGLENPEFDVAWRETGTDKDGRPQYDYRSADDAFALLDEEDAIAAQVSVCVGRSA